MRYHLYSATSEDDLSLIYLRPLHRLTYLASPLYSKCTIRVKGVDPLALEELHVSRL